MAKSELEELLAGQIRILGLPQPEREYRFAPGRRWRLDFAFLDPHWLAVAVEGGTYSGGRHVRGSGFEKDAEKYNAAVLLGFRVLRVTGNMVRDGRAVALIEEALTAVGATPGSLCI